MGITDYWQYACQPDSYRNDVLLVAAAEAEVARQSKRDLAATKGRTSKRGRRR